MASSSYNDITSFPSTGSGWDVFLSFRGIDTRFTFTDCLHDSLQRTGIRTFRDDPDLRSGDVISDALKQAIQGSKTYVVVFSENYASSRWCLDELVMIKSMGRLVVPVFYKIEPSDVRHQTGRRFSEAFERHKTRFNKDILDKWRVTLTKVADLSGYHVLENTYQASIINKVVDRISLEINPTTLQVAKYPVGLDSGVEYITTLLRSDTEGVFKFGIHGMGGVGKTTLAKAVYNQNHQRFEGSSFLANVREVSATGGLACLQAQLLNDVLKCKDIEIKNVDQGIELIRARISFTKKILLVIDDLQDTKSLEFLEGPFALGSVIIITTRNDDLLDSINVKARYKVNTLGDAESSQLFTQHAIGDNNISDTFTELSKEILEHAGGLPLALEVFGSNLFNQPEEKWRWFIDKLKRVPIDDVGKRLVVSFDALKLVDTILQDMFLDIACFFIGGKKKDVVKLMETCYTFVNYYIDILMKRCLLTINDKDELEMHDVLRDMGREIAHNNSSDPGKHSRLWVSKDIRDVLIKHKGTEAIEVIIPGYFFNQDALGGVSFTAETFKRMSKLRFLYLKDVNVTGSFEHKFEDLRVLRWDSCPLKCLPSEFHPQKLVILELPGSKLRTMWEQNMLQQASQVFEKLKTLNISYSIDLTATPDFTKLPCLETLDLVGCHNLKEVHISIGNLASLVSLNMNGCRELKSLPDTICNLRALEVLSINTCISLEALPVGLGDIESLKEIHASELTISTLPDSIGRLSKLVTLQLTYNYKLESLPTTISNLRALEFPSVHTCPLLKALPILDLSNMKQLKYLNVSTCSSLREIEGLKELTSITELHLGGCNSSLVAPTRTRDFFQIYSGFGREIMIHTSKLPDWISLSSNCAGSTLSLDLPNVSHNFLAMILCFKHLRDWGLFFKDSEYSVKNSTRSFIRTNTVYHRDAMILIVPRTSIVLSDGDDRIELTSTADVFGIYLLYKAESTRTDSTPSPSLSRKMLT